MDPPSRFGGGARLVRVVYFLCRNGVVEQPHHIHHLHRSGVNLQDVKRWLSELRGKEVGESFAWSYKRRYKTGFVWQEVKDYELITPISDNEYVLMGSELPHEHTNPLFETFTPGETLQIELELQLETTVNTMPEILQIDRDLGEIISPKPPPRQDQDSLRATVPPIINRLESPRATVPPIINRPESQVTPPIPLSTSSSTSDASKQMVVIKVDAWKQNGARVQAEKKQRQETEKEHSGACLGGKGGSGTCLGRKGGSCNAFYSGSGKKASNVFQNFLKPCRAVSTDDSVMPGARRRERDMLAGGVAGEVPNYRSSLDGSNRQCRPANDGKNTRMGRERVVSAVYMPAAEPNCSQCGKSFNPEKLHSHMKSCKALRRSKKD